MKIVTVYPLFTVVDLDGRYGLARGGLVEFVAYTAKEVEARALALGLFNSYAPRPIHDQWLKRAVLRLNQERRMP